MESSCWCDVPHDIRSEILSKVFLRDRYNFNLVCKSWNSTIPLPLALPPPQESPCFNSPCLIFPQTSKSCCKLFHSLYNDFYYLDFPADAAEIRFSKDGWLLMSRENGSLFLFNPFTSVKFNLPPTPTPFFSVCFTSPPTSPGCYIFGVFVCESDFGLIKFGDNKWKVGQILDYDFEFWHSDCPPLLHNEVYYWLEYQKKNLRILDLAKIEKYQWSGWYGQDGYEIEEGEDGSEEEEGEDNEEEIMVEEKGTDNEEETIEESYVLEVEGDIWGVFIKNDGREISVEKLDLSKMCWTKLETLGDKCVYVSTSGSFAETCTNSELANKIYLDKFYNKSGVIYSLSTGMYYTAKGDVIHEENIYRLTQMGHAAWIKPTL